MSATQAAPRYAIYYAPAPTSPWWAFGAGWLGRDERSDRPLPQQPPGGLAVQAFAELTSEPRRYGFHATLKAPMRLREGAGEAHLLERLAQVARGLKAVPLGRLEPVFMDGFVALVPPPDPAISRVADACVAALDPLRAPLNREELARRQPERLDERGRELLARYGYPHVLERFRFHMTLSGPGDAAAAQRLIEHLEPVIRPLNAVAPPVLDRLCVFRQGDAGANFVRVHDEVLAP